MDALFSLSYRLMASVMLVGVLTTPTLAADPLSDEALDTLGAGGEMLGVQSPEVGPQALPDAELDEVVASAFSTFVWPFQYVPRGIPRLLRTVQASDGKGGTVSIGIFGQGRSHNPIPPQP